MPLSNSDSRDSISNTSRPSQPAEDDDDDTLFLRPGANRVHATSDMNPLRRRSTRDSESPVDERSSLLGNQDGGYRRDYTGHALPSDPGTPRAATASRHSRPASIRMLQRNRSRAGSFSMRLVNALGTQRRLAMGKPSASAGGLERLRRAALLTR
jgi:hypothetical protein